METKKAYSIQEILTNDSYIIPIYQRNYAWGRAEISQFINDIFEFFGEGDKSKSYYIGSLVCFKRPDGKFELIDGQQRYTTIALIDLVLKSNELEWFKKNQKITETNLKFDARKNSQKFIEELYKTPTLVNKLETLNNEGVENFKSAFNIIKEEFKNKKLELFAENFYNHVKLFRIEVPQETDLNHYFEIMNNRGEQLEKQEIVKSRLIARLKDSNDAELFATIWDACSDMSNYIWFNFEKENRDKLIVCKNNLFSDLKEKLNLKEKLENNDSHVNNNSTLENILSVNNKEESKQDSKDSIDKYKSVIDFPNFLLQVLKLIRLDDPSKTDEVSLDDKKLLEEFEKCKDAEVFISCLLYYRIIFDTYIIKQDINNTDESKHNWSIRTINANNKDNEKFENLFKTFENIDDSELVNLQTMLYYSNPTNSNNHWVHEILKMKKFDLTPFIQMMFKISKDKFDKAHLTYPEITIFNLYFIDFLLWKLYKDEVQNTENNRVVNVEDLIVEQLKKKIKNRKQDFYTFKFKQLNSKEHLLPQSKATENESSVLNNLGNLCLISTSQNSSANNVHPVYKKEKFKLDNSSLKRLIMFESYNGDNWSKAEIEKHQEEINVLLDRFG